MICDKCGSHVRKTDIENSMFRMIAGQIVGDVQCYHCKAVTRVIQIIDYVPVNFDKKRRGDL